MGGKKVKKMRKILPFIFTFFLISVAMSPAYALKVTSFTVNVLNEANVIVAFDDLDKTGLVVCIFYNKADNPVGKARGYIDGVGSIKHWFALNTEVSSVRCSEK
jgi:hypothetical protein